MTLDNLGKALAVLVIVGVVLLVAGVIPFAALGVGVLILLLAIARLT